VAIAAESGHLCLRWGFDFVLGECPRLTCEVWPTWTNLKCNVTRGPKIHEPTPTNIRQRPGGFLIPTGPRTALALPIFLRLASAVAAENAADVSNVLSANPPPQPDFAMWGGEDYLRLPRSSALLILIESAIEQEKHLVPGFGPILVPPPYQS